MRAYMIDMLKLFGIVFLRFQWVPRLWCVWLVAVNAASLAFLEHIEGQIVLAVTTVAVAVQTVVYRRIGFTRILGTAHILWIPMFAWMATRIDTIAQYPALSDWILVLLATNAISLGVDAIDAFRFWRGERRPHYLWDHQQFG